MPAPLAFRLEPLPGVTTLLVVAESGGAPAACGEFLEAIRGSAPSRAAFVRTLAAAPFEAFAWECRAFFADDLDAPVEMVVVDSPALATREADPVPS
jgi:hypothetical protein